ncbi:hypothetical protein [Gimesia algae]|uniref:Uncharacterized protein n=1 Tax=Gimesia algae TaxID=2527971 RepID=A0A517V824_9PLAN|nr:hypothetical protein [Gimesia algae]QDT89155.1 hypothetical protein Pan161_07810 [Gimesia algae]
MSSATTENETVEQETADGYIIDPAAELIKKQFHEYVDSELRKAVESLAKCESLYALIGCPQVDGISVALCSIQNFQESLSEFEF